MNREQAISRILSRRQQHAKGLASLDQVAVGLQEALTELDAAQVALQSRVEPDTALTFGQIARTVDDLLRRLGAVRRDIGRTGARFRRPYLTVGAVGRSGQGKSRFLQSLTGLTDQEIPAARGGFMTGVPSAIRHTPGPTTAEVELHDETSFLADVLGPYYAELGLGAPPISVDAFARAPLPALPEGASNRYAHAYDHLRSYHDHLPEYRHHLEKQTRVVPIPPAKILRFVAQHDQAGKPSHDFRAVRRVRITAQFPQGGLGSLAVIDLPGLGDTNLHDEHLLRQALDGEVDVVLFIRRPDNIREDVHDYDVALYDVARSALPELPVDRWSFFILNRVDGVDGDNSAGVAQFAQALRRSRLRVIDVAVANCTSPDEVAAAFDTIVEQSVRIVDELDQALIARRRQDLAALLAEAAVLVSDARAVTGRAVPSGSWFSRFQTLFNQTYEQLARALDELVDELRERTTESDPRLAREIDAAVERARATITAPGIEEIKTRRAVEGSYAAALSKLVDELRTRISRQFLELNDALRDVVEAMHRDVAEVLTDAGRLGGLGGQRGREFLLLLAEWAPHDGSAPELQYALRFLTDFRLNYRGLIQHRVRRVLDKLAPDTIAFPADAGPTEIRYILEELLEETLYDIQTELSGMAYEPQAAVFAVAEEFRDRVLRSPGVQDEWRTTYESLRSDIWSDEFAALAENTALFNQWSQAVEKVAAVAHAGAGQGSVV